MDKIKLQNAFSLMKKLPSSDNNKSINSIVSLFRREDLQKELNTKIEKTLEISNDDIKGKFIICKYNKVEGSYRSPWSNEYFPNTNSPKFLPEELRKLEMELGRLFKIYTKLYYNDLAVSSVYIWDLGDNIQSGFSLVLLVKNELEKNVNEWNSINLISVKFSKEKESNQERIRVTYKLTSTMIVKTDKIAKLVHRFGNYVEDNKVEGNEDKTDNIFSTTLIRNIEESHIINDYLNYAFHVEKIGKLVENTENSMRINIEQVQLKKVGNITNSLRNPQETRQQVNMIYQLIKSKQQQEENN